MDYVLNGFRVYPDDFGDGVVWFEWRTAFFCYNSDSCGRFDRNELHKLSPCNIRHNGFRGRLSKTYVNGLGIYEWLCRSLRYTGEERIRFISELKDLGLIPSDSVVFVSRKELDFFGSLSCFLRIVCPSVELRRQVPMCDKYVVDGFFDGLVIEYDENMHYSYDSEKERVRELEIVSSGYPVVRVNDKMDIGEAIGVIWRHYIDFKK